MARIEAILKRLKIESTDRHRDRLWARCPFHDDAHASWFIRDRGARFGLNHCFSCKNGGTLVDLVMHVRGVDYPTAREWLDGFGEEETEPEPPPAGLRIEVLPTTERQFRLPREMDAGPLEDWPSPARDYVKGRGITDAQVERWRLGYAVSGRLAGRIVLPVFDIRGAPVGYQARTFVDSEKRYLYPRAEERSNLDVMFGEEHWPGADGQCGRTETLTVVVTEGAIDALAVERAVGGHIAALGGSLVRPMHASKLSLFDHVVVLTDDDAAGNRAADELMNVLGRHTHVRRVRLPEGTDAASVSVDTLRRALA